ncbi:unnamed protein product [Phytomonas sp. Hart1]|nr:unnamed protein product [Phytomonas sp. Hart1]|eukprot:CCW69857.1 unnamed protein product [Phytomonas sp. isolate Hart1]
MHFLSLLTARRMRTFEDAHEVSISGTGHNDSRRFMREGNELELQNTEQFVSTGNEIGQHIEIVGVTIENRVRPRARLPRGVVVVPHEDERVYIDFRKLPEVPEAEPPPPTEEELRRIMEEKNRVASPEFYGRSEYIERHGSGRSTPQHLYSNSFSFKQGNHRASTGFYAGSVSSSCSVRSHYEPTTPYAVSLQNFLEHYRQRQQSENLFIGSFRENGVQRESSLNNSQNIVYPAMESTSDEFDDSGSDRGGSVRQAICATTCEDDASRQWQLVRHGLEPNGHPEPTENVPHGIIGGHYSPSYRNISPVTRSGSTLSSSNAFGPSREVPKGNHPSIDLRTALLNLSSTENDVSGNSPRGGGRNRGGGPATGEGAGRQSPTSRSTRGVCPNAAGGVEKPPSEGYAGASTPLSGARGSHVGGAPLSSTPRLEGRSPHAAPPRRSTYCAGSRLPSPVLSASSLETIIALQAKSSGRVSSS